MHKIIFKYSLNTVECVQEFHLPRGAKFLSLQIQKNSPVMWFLNSTNKEGTEFRRVFMYGTGYEILETDLIGTEFLGTVQGYDGLVRHYFIDR